MRIAFYLIAGLPGEPDPAASVSGDVLTVDGVHYDLSAVPEGGEAEPQGEHPFAGPITRSGGVLNVPLIWRYAAAEALRHQPAPEPMIVADGPVPDPVARPEVQS